MNNSWVDVLKSNINMNQKSEQSEIKNNNSKNKVINTDNQKNVKNNTQSLNVDSVGLSDKSNVLHSVVSAKTYDMLPCRFVRSSSIELPVSESFGLIPYDPINDKYLLVKRRYNPAFLTLLRGNYRDSELAQLLGSLGTKEVELIKLMVKAPENISNFHGIFFKSLEYVDYCKIRFASQHIIKLTENLKGSGDGEWLFPSGRPHNEERPISTAIREFCEETGALPQEMKLNKILTVAQTEKIETLSKIHIRHYYPYITNVNITIRKNVDENEISEVSWMSESQALTSLSPQRYKILLQCRELIHSHLKSNKG